MTTSVPSGQPTNDDWFDIDKYKEAAGVAFDFTKKKAEVAGEQDRAKIGKMGEEERTTERVREARDAKQAEQAYRY